MDPLTHAFLGASVAALASRKGERRKAILVGALAGMAPDLDVLIRSSRDPLLWIEYHRHFSHSLFFAPFGALICAWVFRLFLRKEMPRRRIYLFSLLGYLSHPLLDACTSYGTLLLWPFSLRRVSWDLIGIIDLFYTLPLLALLLLAVLKRDRRFAVWGLILSCAYLLFGACQRHRATAYARQVIASRGQEAQRLELKPTVLNLFLWRMIYESEGRYRVDALRVGPFLEGKIYPGETVEKYDWRRVQQGLPQASPLAEDLGRFAWFAQDFLYSPPGQPELAADLRYSMLPQEALPLWGILVDPAQAQEHAPLMRFRGLRERKLGDFFKMVRGEDL